MEKNDSTKDASAIRDDSTDYPCWLFREGDASKDGMICGSKEVEDDWAKRNFVRAGHAVPDTYRVPVPGDPPKHDIALMLDPSPKDAPGHPGENVDVPVMKVDPKTKAAKGVTSAKAKR